MSNNSTILSDSNSSALPNQEDEMLDFEYSTQMVCEVFNSIERSCYPQEIILTEVEW